MVKKKLNIKQSEGKYFVGAVSGVYFAGDPTGSYPKAGIGPMIGYAKNTGVFVKFKSDFTNFDYQCTESGYTSEGYILSQGNDIYSISNISAGMIFRAARPLSFYAGAGYSAVKVGCQDVKGRWVEISGQSFSAMALTAGAILKLGPIGFTVGSLLTFDALADLEFGITVWL